MNAILRERREAPVLTNEAIEVHLSYLRPAVEELRAQLPELRREIKTLDEKVSGKIEALDNRLSGKIEALDNKVSGKIEALSNSVNERIMKIQASMDGLKWFVGSLAILTSGISVAHNLGWL